MIREFVELGFDRIHTHVPRTSPGIMGRRRRLPAPAAGFALSRPVKCCHVRRSMISRSSLLPVLACGLALVLGGCASDEAVSPTVKPADPAALGGNPATPAAPGAPAGSVTPGALAPATAGTVQTTYSGLKYEVLRPGTGARPASYNRVKVHYHGYLPDGTVFDSSVQRGQPATFGLNQVIAGWREGIPLMQEGAKYRFTVPPHLAYGQRGMPPKIGPNQTLMFEVELLQVLY